ncbi:DNA repair protein UVH3-like isoform X3 [Olea europaea var. sylvestris]|uniref:DNA repair protein UVH3-like isoform X3 n=1 Tax=Olea europaea var. sylvestris TaxID=158386 RepID=UPI000C1CD0E4|nr:DNA repair protein UVH3-like isoform X3 [Olea europaea var. sylvestris]
MISKERSPSWTRQRWSQTQKDMMWFPKVTNKKNWMRSSLASEEDGFTADVSTSGTGIPDEEDDENEDEEMILPEMHGKIDPAVLAALPPSMQLDLLVQMRERLMAENRQKYQKVKKVHFEHPCMGILEKTFFW